MVGWYASHPAEPIRGSVVRNPLQKGEPSHDGAPWPLVPGTVHPPAFADAVAAARVQSLVDLKRCLARARQCQAPHGTCQAPIPDEYPATAPEHSRENLMASILTAILSVLFLPLTLLGSWLVVSPQQEIVLLRWGRFSRLMQQPGLYWAVLWGRRAIRISTKQQAIEVHRTVVADGNGNPIVVAAVVTFRFVDTKRAALDVEDAPTFVRTQAMAVLKQVASRYPYESATHETSLKSETVGIAREMRDLLQSKVGVAGAEVVSFELSDLSYAPEIARAMLVRQQAQALVDARKVIVDGAVQIVHHAIELLGEKGHTLQPNEKARLVSNLLVVICGEAHVQPTVSMQSGDLRDPTDDDKTRALLETIAKNTAPTQG